MRLRNAVCRLVSIEEDEEKKKEKNVNVVAQILFVFILIIEQRREREGRSKEEESPSRLPDIKVARSTCTRLSIKLVLRRDKRMRHDERRKEEKTPCELLFSFFFSFLS